MAPEEIWATYGNTLQTIAVLFGIWVLSRARTFVRGLLAVLDKEKENPQYQASELLANALLAEKIATWQLLPRPNKVVDSRVPDPGSCDLVHDSSVYVVRFKTAKDTGAVDKIESITYRGPGVRCTGTPGDCVEMITVVHPRWLKTITKRAVAMTRAIDTKNKTAAAALCYL